MRTISSRNSVLFLHASVFVRFAETTPPQSKK
uniref:Uncharacterized protein n=1 Tax=Cucumis melo TaxID=3656 RepID=A0A9I9D6L9_CUCME